MPEPECLRVGVCNSIRLHIQMKRNAIWVNTEIYFAHTGSVFGASQPTFQESLEGVGAGIHHYITGAGGERLTGAVARGGGGIPSVLLRKILGLTGSIPYCTWHEGCWIDLQSTDPFVLSHSQLHGRWRLLPAPYPSEFYPPSPSPSVRGQNRWRICFPPSPLLLQNGHKAHARTHAY